MDVASDEGLKYQSLLFTFHMHAASLNMFYILYICLSATNDHILDQEAEKQFAYTT